MGKANRGRDTGPERALRSALHRRGLRFRVQRRADQGLRVTPDITFGPARLAVFVDGCFWHRCPDHGNLPTANHEWWREKLEANVARDRRADAALSERGWTVIRIWEHEDMDEMAALVEAAVRKLRAPPTSTPTRPWIRMET